MLRALSLLLILVSTAGIFSCATSPLGRKQFIAVPDSMMDSLGAQSFRELQSKTPIVREAATETYIRCIVNPLLAAANENPSSWEIKVFQEPSANAFALPGRKIGVHTGIMKVAATDSQLAAVLGHEIGHVLARHGAERVSQGIAAQGGMTLLNAFVSGQEMSGQQKALIMGLAGAGMTVGVMLPFSRSHESEADLIGLDLMARAGFDPRQSVELWKNMARTGGGRAPEWLSTHPTSDTRIRDLEANMAGALAKQSQAQLAGRAPRCQR